MKKVRMARSCTPTSQRAAAKKQKTDRVPVNLLAPTGRLEAVLGAWGRGHLAEVPTGLGFDVLRIPGALAEDTVRRMETEGAEVGPIILGPSGAEIILRLGSTLRWTAPRSTVLLRGTLVLLPPPSADCPETAVGDRYWLVTPAYHRRSCPLGHGVTWGADVLEPYLDAVKTAEAAEAEAEAVLL